MFKNFKKQKYFLKNNGFTIMEMIVVIFVISLGMIGILSLVVQNVRVEYINKNRLIASQLSQEGLELVRNMRDNNWLNEVGWKTGIVLDGEYAVDITGTVDVDAVTEDEAKLYVDTDGFYRHLAVPGNATSTIFSRIIIIENELADNIEISCLVQWERGTNTYQYKSQTMLYDWR